MHTDAPSNRFAFKEPLLNWQNGSHLTHFYHQPIFRFCLTKCSHTYLKSHQAYSKKVEAWMGGGCEQEHAVSIATMGLAWYLTFATLEHLSHFSGETGKLDLPNFEGVFARFVEP